MKIESDLFGIEKITYSFCRKVTKMGSIIGHIIDYKWVGALRSQRHILSKNLLSPNHPPPPPPPR